MKGDLSRNIHSPDKRYTSVRLQQGRVSLDADWNEQADIVQREIRERMRDTAGDGAPAGLNENGYRISVSGSDLSIGPGRYYVAGVAVENPAQHLISAQEWLPGYIPPDPAEPGDAGVYLVYLETHERAISYLEDANLREVALGGPDTTFRTQTIGQVKLLGIPDAAEDLDANSEPATWIALQDGSAGAMLAEIAGGVEAGGYRLPENFLYRVEIHEGGTTGAANFKWSRNNASFASSWLDASGPELLVRSTARDANKSFAAGQWVELIDEGRELRAEPGTLARVVRVNDDIVEIDPASATGPYDLASFSEGRRLLRAWDMIGSGALTTGETPVELEGGISVTFEAPEGSTQHRTGDYWMIPARAISKDIEWPRDESGLSLFQPPHGVSRAVSRLAFLQLAGGVWNIIADTRVRFPSLSDIARSDNLIENKLNRFGDTMTGTLNIEAGLNVDLDVRLKQNLNVDQNLTVKGDFYVEGDLIARDTQHQPGDVLLGDQDEDTVTLHGTLKSEHTSGALRIDDDLHVAQNITVLGSIAGGPAAFQGDTSIAGTADITGDVTIAGNLAIGPGANAETHQLDVDGDVRADRFIGDGSLLMNVGNARSYYAALPEYLYPTNDPARHGLTDSLGRRLFYTTILNRAPMLSPAAGIFLGRRRVLFDDFVPAPNERGPNGERVYMIEGRDDLRQIGDVPEARNDEHGNRLILRESAGHILEYTGYFNAVQPLYRSNPEFFGYRAKIDGGPEQRIFANHAIESPNAKRYYDAISSGLERFETSGPPGVHSIRIAPDNVWDAYGLELIATRTDTVIESGDPIDHTNKIDIPAQNFLLNGETTPLPAQTLNFRIDPWHDGYGLHDDRPGYYDEGLDAWEDHIPLALVVTDHTVPQVFDPPLNVHDHILNTTTGVVHRVKFFKNLVAGEHQAVSPDKIIWDTVSTIGRSVSDITSRTDLIPNEIVYSQTQSRVYKVLATDDGTFATTRFNRRRPLNGARVAWFVHPDSRDDAGNARLACATVWLPPRGSTLGEQPGIRGTGMHDQKAFQIDGELYVATTNHNNESGGYNQNSQVLRWDGERFIEFQSFATNGAYDWEYFMIAGEHYLVVANYHNGSTTNLASHIYKWNGTGFDAAPFQGLSNTGALDCEFFTIAGEHYLAITEHPGNLNTRIFKWNGTQFDAAVFQNIGRNHGRESKHFTIDGEHFLAITNQQNGGNVNINSYIYKWNGTQFDTASPWPIPTNHGWGVEAFAIGDRHFVAFANYFNGSIHNIPSHIYEWNGTDFVLFQEVVVPGASSWRFLRSVTNVFCIWEAGTTARITLSTRISFAGPGNVSRTSRSFRLWPDTPSKFLKRQATPMQFFRPITMPSAILIIPSDLSIAGMGRVLLRMKFATRATNGLRGSRARCSMSARRIFR